MIKFAELLHYNRIRLIGNTYSEWLAKGDNVLDVGCGDGILVYELSRQFDIHISGCDIENYLVKPINFVLMKNENKLPFPDKSFDTVLFTDVLHHVSTSTQKSLLSESLRVTRKNVVIFEPKPTIGVYIADIVINKIYHPSMKIPFTYKHKTAWLSLFHRFPVRVDSKEIPRPFLSLVSHVAFRLIKK